MRLSRPNIIRAGASAAVVLATVVNAAAAGERVFTPLEGASVDLSWAVRGGGAQSVQSARALWAKKAATSIRSLDCLSSPPAAALAMRPWSTPDRLHAQVLESRAPALLPAAGPVQSSAP